ncbi:MAG: recombinase family protein [Clostridia bacterium]|nr:recombinase family protein [Clostridia bacterium]
MVNRQYRIAKNNDSCYNNTTDKPFALWKEDYLKLANGIRTAGIYCRLSNDDGNVGISDSIMTQKKYLVDYCQNNDITVYDIYIDDGFSGTRFNRPAFQRMMADAKAKKINTIIVKDMSRFGRDSSECGRYIDRVLPEMGVTLIAAADNIDTLDPETQYDITIPVRNLMNGFYPMFTSKNTKLALRTKAKNGEFIGSKAPLGFVKSPMDKHKLELDEEAAPLIVRIFNMAASGYGLNRIARTLSKENVLTPMAYLAAKEGRSYDKDPYNWDLTTVRSIINNEAYLGHLVSGKRTVISYKSRKVVDVDKSKWIIVENVFPRIISDRLWTDAHKSIESRKRESTSGFENIFAGLLKCDKCGHALGISNIKDSAIYYTCDTYRKKGKEACSMHYILYDKLYDAVLKDIRKLVKAALKCDGTIIDSVVDDAMKSDDAESIDKEISRLEKTISDLDRKYDRMYQDRLDDVISAEKFKEYADKITADKDRAKAALDELKTTTDKREEQREKIKELTELAHRYSKIKTLDYELLHLFIDSITVGEKDKETNEQRITINYKFVWNFT